MKLHNVVTTLYWAWRMSISWCLGMMSQALYRLQAAALALEDGLTHAYLGMLEKAQDSLNQVIDKAPPERTRILAYNSHVLALLKSSGRNMEQTVTTWVAAMQGATTLRSEQRWQEAMENYGIMQALWPGERRIEELRDLAVHW